MIPVFLFQRSISDPAGTFYVLDHGLAVNSKVNEPVTCTFSDGAISGDVTGTYTVTEGTNYVTLNIGKAVYKGVMINMTDEAGNNVFCISATGDNNHAIWCVHYMVDEGADATDNIKQ
jgi:arabinan endo-1,5-alpha-L-arabinosidase